MLELIKNLITKIIRLITGNIADRILDEIQAELLQEQTKLADGLETAIKDWEITIYGKKFRVGDKLLPEVKDDIDRLRNSQEIQSIITKIKEKI